VLGQRTISANIYITHRASNFLTMRYCPRSRQTDGISRCVSLSIQFCVSQIRTTLRNWPC